MICPCDAELGTSRYRDDDVGPCTEGFARTFVSLESDLTVEAKRKKYQGRTFNA